MSDEKLKQALAKMLPEIIMQTSLNFGLFWVAHKRPVIHSELLHLCALVENTLTGDELRWYGTRLERIVFDQASDDDWNEQIGASINTKVFHATWQQRATALAKVKGIEL